jgi:predicted transcriptional regulator
MEEKTRQEKSQAFRPGEEGVKQVLGDLEADIMESVWKAAERALVKEVSVREVMEDLTGRRSVAYATVKTVMNRLVEKGHLSRRKEDRAFFYCSPVSREEFRRRMCTSVVEGLLSGADSELMLSHLVDSVSEEDSENLDRLAALIETKRQQIDKSSPDGKTTS